ncbi:MAG: hypothetical protein Q9210_005646 [Variospora velana]
MRLDQVLQSLQDPPSWSLISESTEPRSSEHLRQPEYSQSLITALQLCIIAVLETWNIRPRSTIGHSSGEIAAAYATGLLDRAGAIIAAFYRDRAALNCKKEVDSDVGMLAVGLGAEATTEYLAKYVGQARIACFNSPSSKVTPADALYWETNMVSAVRFDDALKAMLEDARVSNFLIEIGPSGALPGPVSQVLKALPTIVEGEKHRVPRDAEDAANIAPNDLCYRFCNTRFNRTLVLEEGKDAIIISTLTKVPGSKDWHEFRISTLEGDVLSEHCSGLARMEEPVDEPLEGEVATPLKSPQAPKLWYKFQREIGMEFAPSFQKLLEAINGQRSCRTLMSMSRPEGRYSPQSYYPIHPAALDGCLQTVVPSNAWCDRTNVKSVMILALIDDFVINRISTHLNEGRSKATSVYSGRDRMDIEKSWVANTSVWDVDSGQLAMRITGLNYTKLDVAPKRDPHTFHCVSWKPDITHFTQDQMTYLTPTEFSTKLDTVIDLIAHKKPALRVLELNLNDSDTSSLWFNPRDFAARAAYSQYDFASPSAKTLVTVETGEKLDLCPVHMEKKAFGLPTKAAYDLAIVKTLEAIAYYNSGRSEPKFSNHFCPVTPSYSWYSSICSATSDHGSAKKHSKLNEAQIFGPLVEIPTTSNNTLAYLSRSTDSRSVTASRKNLMVVRLAETTPLTFPSMLQAVLETSGWNVSLRTSPIPKSTDGAVILILDELWNPVLTQADGKQWEVIKALVSSGDPLLWVSRGAQNSVTDPDNAVVHGLFRHGALTTLDVQSSTSPAGTWVIENVLELLRDGTSLETEYMERKCVLHIARIMLDVPWNDFRHAEEEGLEPIVKGFHETEAQVQLRAERLGTLQSLMWCETESCEPPLGTGNIEVEVMAVGVNFQEVAISMGIVPDDEYNIGFECAGLVKRLGPDVTKFKVGDGVCMLKAGS